VSGRWLRRDLHARRGPAGGGRRHVLGNARRTLSTCGLAYVTEDFPRNGRITDARAMGHTRTHCRRYAFRGRSGRRYRAAPRLPVSCQPSCTIGPTGSHPPPCPRSQLGKSASTRCAKENRGSGPNCQKGRIVPGWLRGRWQALADCRFSTTLKLIQNYMRRHLPAPSSGWLHWRDYHLLRHVMWDVEAFSRNFPPLLCWCNTRAARALLDCAGRVVSRRLNNLQVEWPAWDPVPWEAGCR